MSETADKNCGSCGISLLSEDPRVSCCECGKQLCECCIIVDTVPGLPPTARQDGRFICPECAIPLEEESNV